MNSHPSPAPNCRRQEDAVTVAEAPKSTHRRHKRQSRRRLHTTQHRLLNTAEARKEIVTALKFHRASSLHHHHQQPSSDQHGGIVSTTTYPSCPNNFSFSSSTSLPNPPNQPAASPLAPQNSLCFNHLPNRPLGLNLNFQDFDNLHASIYSYSSPSSSSAPADAIKTIASSQVAPKSVEHHQVTEDDDDDAAHTVFHGQPMEFPDWLNANDRCFDQYCSQEFVLDPALPCMDIGDFEGMGEEWLA